MTEAKLEHRVLKRAGLPEASDVEVGKFMYEYARVTGGHFGFLVGEQELRALQCHRPEMRATSSEYGLAVADAGMRQIHADRAAHSTPALGSPEHRPL